jgi:intracellular sulfur oxidation DsrE/DsrF family protein
MTSYEYISDEQLNAFVDNQLDAEERNRVFLALKQDDSLSRRVCELQKLKTLVGHAYEQPPINENIEKRAHNRKPYLQGVAAGLLLLAGGVVGWLGHMQTTPTGAPTSFHSLAKLEALQVAPLQNANQNIILHLTSNDAYKVASALDKAKHMLVSYREAGVPIKLEIVANGDGLSLLRSETSPFPERAAELAHNFDNVAILACANTLKLLELQGIDTSLIPYVQKTRSALEKVVNRLQDGWLYIEV